MLSSSAAFECLSSLASPANIRAAIAQNWGGLDLKKPIKALKRMTKAVDQLEDFGDEGHLMAMLGSFSETHDYMIANAKEADKLKASIELLTGEKSEGNKAGGDRKDSKKKAGKGTDKGKGGKGTAGAKRSKKVGDIIVEGDMMAKEMCPDRSQLTKRACGQAMRQGGHCRFGSNCEFNHKPINELCVKDQKAWVRKILTTPTLRFNPDTVDARIREMTLADAAEK